MPEYEDDYRAGIRIYRDHSNEDDSIKSVRHGRMVLDQDENGNYLSDLEGSEAGWQPWLPIEQNGNAMGAWNQITPVICAAPGVIAPIKDVNLTPHDKFFGKFVRSNASEIVNERHNECVAIDGKLPEVGDFGLVVQTINQDEINLLYIPQKKNDIEEPLPIPTLCHGKSDFIESTIPESLKVITSLEIDEDEIFVFTNLFRTKGLLVANKNGGTFISPTELGTGSIVCRGGQTLSGILAQNCEGPLVDVFMYTPNLIPGVIRDSNGDETKIWVVHSDGSTEFNITSSCCDDEENEENGNGEFPDFLRYQDSFGNEQFLLKDNFDPVNNSFSYISPSLDGGNTFQENGFPNNRFPDIQLIPVQDRYDMTVFYGTIEDSGEPNVNGAVVNFMQGLIDNGIDPFGKLQISLSKNSDPANGPLGSYTRRNQGNPFSDEREPPGFSATLTDTGVSLQ